MASSIPSAEWASGLPHTEVVYASFLFFAIPPSFLRRRVSLEHPHLHLSFSCSSLPLLSVLVLCIMRQNNLRFHRFRPLVAYSLDFIVRNLALYIVE